MKDISNPQEIEAFSTLLGIPRNPTRIFVKELGDGYLKATIYYSKPYDILPGSIDGLTSLQMNADATSLVVVLKPQLATYRDIRCMLAGVQ